MAELEDDAEEYPDAVPRDDWDEEPDGYLLFPPHQRGRLMRAMLVAVVFTMGGAVLGLALSPKLYDPSVTPATIALCAIAGLCFGVGVAIATDKE